MKSGLSLNVEKGGKWLNWRLTGGVGQGLASGRFTHATPSLLGLNLLLALVNTLYLHSYALHNVL